LPLTGFQFGIRRGARSLQMKTGFINQNLNFEKSHELKERSEIFKNPQRLVIGLDQHFLPSPSQLFCEAFPLLGIKRRRILHRFQKYKLTCT
jgi:hypothetical protein